MASAFSFGEDNGSQTGSPLKGTTRTIPRTEVNWKNIDDSSTAYSSQPIQAGSNSFIKYQFGAISGSWNTVLNGKLSHTSGTFGAGLTLKATGTNTYATPATTALAAGAVDITSTGLAANGFAINFNTGGPEVSSGAAASLAFPSSTTGYTSYLASQLQTTTGASPGDTATAEITFQYDES